jgi:DNA-binding transcriptional MerR regulator
MPAVGRTPTERGYLSIKEVLDVLVEEFSDITISKIRFLESRGLIHPERTPSGYRKFFEGDVDRLRWILRQQREHFLPLKVIKGRLDREAGGTIEASLFDGDLDDERDQLQPSLPSPVATGGTDEDTSHASPVTVPALPKMPRRQPGVTHEEGAPAAQAGPTSATSALAPSAVSSAAPEVSAAHELAAPSAPEAPALDVEHPVPAPSAAPSVTRSAAAERSGASMMSGACLSASELCGATGAAPGLIEALEEFGLIAASVVGGVRSYQEDALVIARLATSFAQVGVEPRHLAVLKRAADRQAELYAQAVAPLLRQRNPAARSQAQERLDQLVDVGTLLQETFVKAALQRQIGSSAP